MQFTLDGFTARDVELRKVIQEAYGVYEEDRLYGGPTWVNTAKFDIEAKIDSVGAETFKELSLSERRSMLQGLLAERFKLNVRHEMKDLPVFSLVKAKGGPRLKKSKTENSDVSDIKGYSALVTHSQPGELDIQNCSMADLASILEDTVGRIILDKTQLSGRYDVSLRWTPESVAAAGNGATNSDWPTLFTALQEQRGLRLESTKSAIGTIVIDHVESPSEN